MATTCHNISKSAEAVLCCSEHKFEWPVNLAVANPSEGSPLAIVVGDDPEAIVLDMRTKAAVMRLKGHLDYSFAASWHPNDAHTVATGNQVLPLFYITLIFKVFMSVSAKIETTQIPGNQVMGCVCEGLLLLYSCAVPCLGSSSTISRTKLDMII